MFDNYKIDSWQKGILYLVTILAMVFIFFLGKKKMKFSFRVLIAMALGIVVGLTLGQTKTTIGGNDVTIITTIRPIGQLYLRMIQMVIMPLVLTAIIKSFTSLESTDKLKKIGLKTIFWLLFTTALATIIGYTVAAIFGLGKGFPAIEGVGKTITPIETVILNFFPNNITSAMTGNVAIPVVIFAIFISIAFMVEHKRKPERVQPFLDFNNALNQLLTRIIKFVIKFTPYAVFTFMAYAVGRNNVSALKELLVYVGLIYLAMAIHFVVVQMGLLAAHKVSPIQFVKKFFPAMVVAFTTQSSYGTMPVTIDTLKDRVGVSERVANFVAPIGANVGMNACGGIFPAMVAVIAANATGNPLNLVQVIILVIITTLSSIGIAGVPGIATIAATVVLSALDLPLEAIALVVAVDPLVDMGRTLVNVIGVGVSATLVAKSEKEFDSEMFNSKEIKVAE